MDVVALASEELEKKSRGRLSVRSRPTINTLLCSTTLPSNAFSIFTHRLFGANVQRSAGKNCMSDAYSFTPSVYVYASNGKR